MLLALDEHIVIGVASLLGCAAMLWFCVAQLLAMLEVLRCAEATVHPWETNSRAQSAQSARDNWSTSVRVPTFAPLDAQLAPSRL